MDEGKTWHTAKIKKDEVLADDSSKHWHWVRWEGAVPVSLTPEVQRGQPVSARHMTVWCRAQTDDGQNQVHMPPQRGGYLWNGYHKVNVTV